MLGDFFGAIGIFLAYTWWFWLLLVLWPITVDTWLSWRQKMYEHHIKWVMLELLIPREILKSPQAMEQVLTQIYALKNYPADISEYWLEGEVTRWNSFEMVSIGGSIHFYLRVPRMYHDLIEAAVFAFYPDIEIIEVEDYMEQYPHTVEEMYRDGIKLWGVELELEKSGAYPLKSYVDFESMDENKQYDPMSTFIELLSKLKPGQMTAIQILAAPAVSPHDRHEIKEYEKEIIALRERKHETDHSPHPGVGTKTSFPGGILPAFETAIPGADSADTSVLRKAVLSRTPGETKVLEAMEENLERPFFRSLIRYVYISPIETFDESYPRRAVFGAFTQYGSSDLNRLRRNDATATRGRVWEPPFIFNNVRIESRRQRMLYDFRHREFPAHHFMGNLVLSNTFDFYFRKHKSYHLNTRSIASLFHPPTAMVLTGPHIKRVDSRKGGPPAGMAIFGDEGEIEKFK